MKAYRIVLIIIMLAYLIIPGIAVAATYDNIYASLKSPGHSGETLDKCGGSESEQIRQDIKQKLAAGQTKEQIIDYYVGIYGEEILAVPTKKGFNLTAWVIPPLAALTGIVLVYFALSGWVRNHGGRKQALHTSGTYVDPVDEERLKEEIRKYL